MCGIAGFIDQKRAMGADAIAAQAKRMAGVLTHRGPDDGQVWVDADAGIGLGFRRLAIQDLSEAGRQPMVSASGRFVICFNGEIYNGEEMRRQLGASAPAWRGHSDTEILLEACEACGASEAWGMEEAVKRAVGMFAFALYDIEKRRLHLVRDRLGKKPLYWSFNDGLLLFGSELRALKAHKKFKGDLSRDALASFVRHGYVPHPFSIYRQVRQLRPGHILTLSQNGAPVIRPYWSLADAVEKGRATPFEGSEDEAIETLSGLLGMAVKSRMVSDVPLGAFLSGGYDSSTVVALMQAHSSRPVRSFSIGSPDKDYDESVYAREVARHLGTDHTELIVTPREAREVIPELPQIYDEPFADSSQIPTYLVSKLARQDVTVALSGDGGDELFTGYNRYVQGLMFSRRIARLPKSMRRAAARAMQMLSPRQWDALFRIVPQRARIRMPSDKMYKLADVLAEDAEGFYRKLTSAWHEPGQLVIGANEPITDANDPAATAIVPDFIERMMYRDTLSYLPGDILTKVDRASMAVSLEVRNPILDHRVVEFAWSLPGSMKLRGGTAKWILRQLAYRHIPRRLLDRPKTGFGIPIDDWLRGPLKDWAEDLLSEEALKSGGLFEPAPIRQRWREHMSGRRNWQYSLWHILMFEAWRRTHHA